MDAARGFSSRRLKIAFQEGDGRRMLKDFDDLRREVLIYRDGLTSAIAGQIENQFTASIINGGRWKKISQDERTSVPEEGEALRKSRLVLIADCWRAARWRVSTDSISSLTSGPGNPTDKTILLHKTTSNKAHETVALATLLGLQAAETYCDKIASVVIDWPW